MTYKTPLVLSEAKSLATIFYSISPLFFREVRPIFIDLVYERLRTAGIEWLLRCVNGRNA